MSLLRSSKGQPLSKGTVLWYAQQIYKCHGVRTLPELYEKRGHPELAEASNSKYPEIRRRLMNGDSIATIVAELKVGKTVIYNQRQRLRKQGTKLTDARVHNRIGSAFLRKR